MLILKREIKWCSGPVSPDHGVPMCPPDSSPSDGEKSSVEVRVVATTNELKLEEKIDDIKKLLELLCGGGVSLALGNGILRENSQLKNNKDVAKVMDQFKSVCNAENIIGRDKILFRKEGKCLGKGQFGTVYKGIKLGTNDLSEMVAVKVIEWMTCTDDNVKSFLREIKMYQDVGSGSSHIVRMMGACVHEGGLWIDLRGWLNLINF